MVFQRIPFHCINWSSLKMRTGRKTASWTLFEHRTNYLTPLSQRPQRTVIISQYAGSQSSLITDGFSINITDLIIQKIYAGQ